VVDAVTLSGVDEGRLGAHTADANEGNLFKASAEPTRRAILDQLAERNGQRCSSSALDC
jgi:hypothetical protein